MDAKPDFELNIHVNNCFECQGVLSGKKIAHGFVSKRCLDICRFCCFCCFLSAQLELRLPSHLPIPAAEALEVRKFATRGNAAHIYQLLAWSNVNAETRKSLVNHRFNLRFLLNKEG